VLQATERTASRSKVVLLVSDGEDLEGGAQAAAAELADDGIRIFALGVGTPGGEPIPVTDQAGKLTGYRKDRRGEPIVTRLDLETLRAVTAKGGGEVLTIGSPDHGPAAFRAAIEQLEKGELESQLTVQYEDRYAVLAFPGFLLLLAALLVGEAHVPAPPDEVET